MSGPATGPTIEDILDDAAAMAAEIARLAALDPISCDRELKAAAKQLGCTVGVLRREVDRRLGRSACR